MMSRISLQKVYKSFQKNLYVISDFDLEIFNDEFLVIVGPSGSGKTTTLRMIAGLEELSDGKLYIDDHLQNDEDPSTRHLSFVFQNYALLPHLTIYENIAFGLLNLKLSELERRKKVEDIARKLSLLEKLGSYPNQLSGGQRQRVALARALVDQEKLILFDEPLSNLDALLRSEMRSELLKLQRMFQTTCVYVTHDQVEAMAMASRIVLMMEGKIVQVGTPYQMYHDPAHLDTSLFIGLPEANLITVTIKDQRIYVDDQEIALNDETKLLIQKNQLSKALITIRPKALRVHHQFKDILTKGKLVAVENFGVSKLLHIEAFNQTFRAEVDQDFIEQDDLYLDFTGETYLFNEDKKRIRENQFQELIFEALPVLVEELQVIRELINYGYHISYDDKKANVLYNKKNHTYQLKMNEKIYDLKNLQDILNILSYRK
ncbi:MAG: sugar ABC transporter ATP-binding protein [Tenericutes bacterium HGW-Tenericutes-2]|jgi:multiple sugar transport system ATP-binding protein|nr:MAG: sugar ABC transporter ATP-binding protein [Tenericutes bacterium HGW-Tenericutes-2]